MQIPAVSSKTINVIGYSYCKKSRICSTWRMKIVLVVMKTKSLETQTWDGTKKRNRDAHTLCIRLVMNCSCHCTEFVVESTSALRRSLRWSKCSWQDENTWQFKSAVVGLCEYQHSQRVDYVKGQVSWVSAADQAMYDSQMTCRDEQVATSAGSSQQPVTMVTRW